LNIVVGQQPGRAEFDIARLASYLEGRLPFAHGRMDVSRIGGGQSNPTYLLRFDCGSAILRKRPHGPTLPSAHAVDREYRVLSALSATPVPVPRTYFFEEDAEVIGTVFYLMEYLHGRVFHDSALPDVSPQERRAMYRSAIEALACIHAVTPREVGLESFGRAGNYFHRQLARWSNQWEQSASGRIPELDRVIEWLDAQMPPQSPGTSIVHGDFRIGNLVFHPTEPRVIGVLDWELATLGDPMADLGYFCMTWHSGPEEYGGINGLELEALGIPGEDEIVAQYESLSHRPGLLKRFHLVFALFRFAVILVGIADRARSGTANDEQAAETGKLAVNYARTAWKLAEQA
jgi:aminoglycoside phosphotransferase (APT) family kinase protein